MKTLDETYSELRGIYLDSNFYKNEFQAFAHLVEVVGGLSSIASGKRQELPQVERFMPKVMAWWLTLAGKVGVRSVEQLLWVKYPGVCPYCAVSPHEETKCKSSVSGPSEPRWELIEERGRDKQRPKTLSEWQRMFYRIYPLTAAESMQVVFARLSEELGELAEAIRVREIAPSYFISEAADVFAWLMRIQSWYNRQTQSADDTLEKWMTRAYPGKCIECDQATCACPAILDSAFGRLAHEVPDRVVPAALMPIEDSLARFRSRTLSFAGQSYELKSNDLQDLRAGVNELLRLAYGQDVQWALNNQSMMDALYQLKHLSSAAGISETLIRQLAESVGELEPSARSQIAEFAQGTSAGVFAWLITMAVTGGHGVLT